MDVGFYWLMYVPLVISKYPNAKFVCLERDKKYVIRSFLKNPAGAVNPIITFLRLCMRGHNEVTYYRETVSEKDLEKMDPSTREFVEFMWDTPMMKYPNFEDRFPDYGIYSAEEFLNKYCDDYHSWAVFWEKEYPENFLRIELNYALNTVEGRNKILNHIGMAPHTTIQ
jgi:hypothetical protein